MMLKLILSLLLLLELIKAITCIRGGYNVAFKKPTKQSSTRPDSGSYRAVSEITSTDFKKGGCSHTLDTNITWWSVDLEERLPVVSVIITRRDIGQAHETRLSNFEIYGSNKTYYLPDDPDPQLCARHPNAIRPGDTETIDCLGNRLHARYIIIWKDMTDPNFVKDNYYLSLCNVEVIRACPYGLYGENCSEECSPNCRTTCFRKSGNCRGSKCKAGYQGGNCTEVCTDGTYGDRCMSYCSKNCLNSCEKFTDYGTCVDGKCKLGYRYGGNCTEECPSGLYGNNCSKECSENCRSTCKKTTGSCSTVNGLKCKAGYYGETCTEVCKAGTYGDRCRFNCSKNCLNSCDKLTDDGTCVDGKCKLGYKYGGNCTEACDDRSYGDNCRGKCNCKGGKPCNKDDGFCTEGCEIGYHGLNCSQECPHGWYGNNCSTKCSEHCRSTCEKTSGSCLTVNGLKCKAGYYEERCTEVCNNGTYGDRCKSNCSKTCFNSCDRFTDYGICLEGKCKPGYKYGGNCTQECASGRYGDNCNSQCQCKNKMSCDKNNGFCSNGCDIGYHGPSCSQECDDGKYGENCSSICSATCAYPACDKHSLLGNCIEGCKEGYSGDICSVFKPPSNKAGLIAGVFVAVLVVVVVVLILIWKFKLYMVCKKDKEREKLTDNRLFCNQNGQDREMAMTALLPPKMTRNDKPTVAVKPKFRNEIPDVEQNGLESLGNGELYANISKSKTLISVSDFVTYLAKLKKEKQLLKDEYENLPNAVYPCDIAESPDLKLKNRYKNIYPYDNNTVPLQQLGHDPLSTYINASFIKDYYGKVSYIAALGATQHTLNDFWRMIWEHNVSLIVMVTNLVEEMKVKCDQYWPSKGVLMYGDISVLITDNLVCQSYTVRTFKATKGSESRHITHYQYTDWPDKSVPENLSALIKIREVIKESRLQKKTPVMIHCSAGVGRTGTVIALDILSEQADKEKNVDIRVCVEALRKQRMNMVQTQVQYVFLHDALAEIFTVGSTLIPCNSLYSYVNSKDGQMKLLKQYDTLQSIKPNYKIDDYELAKFEHKEKNRDMNVVPTDYHRVKLPSTPETYINAVYVKGFKKKSEYIASQIPLPNTVEDFWSMVFECKCTAIVCLETDHNYESWFEPKISPITFGEYTVEVTKTTNSEQMTKYDVTLGKNTDDYYVNVGALSSASEENLKLQLFMLNKWSTNHVSDKDLSNIVESLNQIHEQQQNHGPCVVVCRNGATESGIYIAFSWLLNMADREDEVDVFHVVKQIRKTRPQFICSKEQYVLVHRLLVERLQDTHDYQNVYDD